MDRRDGRAVRNDSGRVSVDSGDIVRGIARTGSDRNGSAAWRSNRARGAIRGILSISS